MTQSNNHANPNHPVSSEDTQGDPFPRDLPAIPKALTIAGSDSGAGAGIQADLKTFAALGVYGLSALTAVTAQNTKGVFAIAEVPDEVIVAQIDVMMEDIGANVAKTGMLSSAVIIEVVADRLDAWGLKTVVDPVMTAKSGDRLLQRSAVAALKKHLLPIAHIVTPNIPEAEIISGREIASDDDAREAARAIHALGPKIVIVKGGHAEGPATDIIFDGAEFHTVTSERVETKNNHGTGCTYSAAIAAYVARGYDDLEAIRAAKEYLTGALKASYAIGGGHSPVNHFYRFPEMGPIAAPPDRDSAKETRA